MVAEGRPVFKRVLAADPRSLDGCRGRSSTNETRAGNSATAASMTPLLPSVLYRRLRQEEVDIGVLLLPKAQTPFLELPRLPLTLPFDFGLRLDHAVRHHQRGELDPLTSGVSTTPLLERAKWYGRNGSLPIVVLDTSTFGRLGATRA